MRLLIIITFTVFTVLLTGVGIFNEDVVTIYIGGIFGGVALGLIAASLES